MLTACILDLDGVVCHTDEFHYQAWKTLCDRHGWAFDRTLNERLRGVSRRESLSIILKDNGLTATEADMQRMMDAKNGVYRSLLMTLTPSDLEADVVPVLQAMRSHHVQVGLGSSSKNAPLILQRLGITGLFDAVIDGSMITKSKPDPEVFLTCASRLGVRPCDAIVVEDAIAGIQAAIRGGFVPVAYRLHVPSLPAGLRHAETFTDLSSVFGLGR